MYCIPLSIVCSTAVRNYVYYEYCRTYLIKSYLTIRLVIVCNVNHRYLNERSLFISIRPEMIRYVDWDFISRNFWNILYIEGRYKNGTDWIFSHDLISRKIIFNHDLIIHRRILGNQDLKWNLNQDSSVIQKRR